MLDINAALALDCEQETHRICSFIESELAHFKCEGAVIGLSGGVDSAVASALCARALGKDRVFGLIMPERESSPDSAKLAARHAEKLGISVSGIDITPVLEAAGSYRERDEAISGLLPEYDSRCKWKMVLPPDLLARDAFNYFTLKILKPNGSVSSIRLDNKTMRRIMAATNIKQRTRMTRLYHAAEVRNYLVCGTTNRNEYIQGFFVKYGDGGVDIEPLSHLYKSQVRRLAKHLGVIPEIINRAPTPDTYSFPVTDEEMYFRMPYEVLDRLLFAWDHKMSLTEVSRSESLTEEQVARAFRDFDSKHRATQNLRLSTVALSSWTELGNQCE